MLKSKEPIDSRTLVPGMVTDQEYYSDRGELLIAKGVAITVSHLDILSRRNIFELYVKISPDEEIDLLVSKEFPELDTIQHPGSSDVRSSNKTAAPDFHSPIVRAIDENLKAFRISDRPIGPALSSKATQLQVAQRTEEYKGDIAVQYHEARRDVAKILDSLAAGHRNDGLRIRRIVEHFIRIFTKDKSILLNISTIKPPDKEYLYHHSLNVCILAINVAASAGYSEKQVLEIGIGALLHDVGMLAIPHGIILKEHRLNKDEWYEVQKHPVIGLNMLERVRNLPESVPYVAYQVHERENGRGYPRMRSGHLIHRYAKIVQIADIYEAMSSPRTYRKAFVPYRTMDQLIKMARQNFISGEFLKALLKYASLFPVGSLVELSNGSLARVIESNPDSVARPIVSVLTDEHGNRLGPKKIIQQNLLLDDTMQITRALPLETMSISLMDGF